MKFRLKKTLQRYRSKKKETAHDHEKEDSNTDDSDTEPHEEDEERPERENRSVNDFQSSNDLRQALLNPENKGSFHNAIETGCSLSNKDLLRELTHGDASLSNIFHRQMSDVDQKLDWVLENYNKHTTIPQDVNQELKRLLVLKSYLVLDTERRDAFDKVTNMASRLFDCPIALISLVDLGRQWFLSNRGLPQEVRETPRKLAFCAHAICSTENALVVLDATKDARFRDSPLVTGPPDVRFYAGAPLVSPEGYKLGTLCVIDSKTRQDFGTEEKQNLTDLAAMAVQALVSHKRMKTVWFRNLEKTRFPEFEQIKQQQVDSCTHREQQQHEASCAAVSDDSSSMHPEDRNVEVFLEKTKRLSLTSFLTVLENQARELHLSSDYLKKYETLAASQPKQAKASSKQSRKKVRFVKDRKVRYQVLEVESFKPIHDLWWSPEETHDIQTEAFSTTLYYRKHKPLFQKSVEIIAKDTEPKVVENHMRLLLKDEKARGLESQIVSLLSGKRKETVMAVLEEQTKCRDELNNDDTKQEGDTTATTNVKGAVVTFEDRLRGTSLLHSKLSSTFAERKAQCDYMDALKASMSPWRPTAVPQLPCKVARIA